MISSYHGYEYIVKLLLDAGADIAVTNNVVYHVSWSISFFQGNMTALMLAQEKLHNDIVFRIRLMSWFMPAIVCCTSVVLLSLLVVEVYFVMSGDNNDVIIIVKHCLTLIAGRHNTLF